MGEAGEGQNTTHSQKKLGLEQVAKFAERFDIPVTKEDVKQLNFYKDDWHDFRSKLLVTH
jgi:pyruvate dehydrogenase E1 component